MTRCMLLFFMICLSLSIPLCCGDTINIVDYTGKQVNLSLPINRTMSLSNMATEIICALDGGKSLVGRPNSAFPAYVDKVEVVGENSRSPDLERIVEIHPDILIADGMLSDNNRKLIEDAGIPVIVEKFAPSRATIITENMGLILGKKERAQEIADFIKEYEDLIDERTAKINADEKTSVYVEWNQAYRAASTSSGFNNCIEKAGGVNVVSNASVQYPIIDSEWLIQQDPSVIIKLLTSTKDYIEEDMLKEHNEIAGRSELNSMKAIKDGRTYVISGILVGGIRSVIGELYFAKWLYPEQFKEIDPESVHKEMLQKFYGQEIKASYAYPSGQ